MTQKQIEDHTKLPHLFENRVDETFEDKRINPYDLFKDDDLPKTADFAEAKLLKDIDEEAIDICTTDDIGILADRVTGTTKGLSDLHLRSSSEENLSSRKWGAVDLLDTVEKAVNENVERSVQTSLDAGTEYKPATGEVTLELQKMGFMAFLICWRRVHLCQSVPRREEPSIRITS